MKCCAEYCCSLCLVVKLTRCFEWDRNERKETVNIMIPLTGTGGGLSGERGVFSDTAWTFRSIASIVLSCPDTAIIEAYHYYINHSMNISSNLLR